MMKRTRNFERREITEVLPVHSTTAENVHDIVDKGGSVTFTRRGSDANAGEFGPLPPCDIENPGVVKVRAPVRASKSALHQLGQL